MNIHMTNQILEAGGEIMTGVYTTWKKHDIIQN
jgi:hypothetical protein